MRFRRRTKRKLFALGFGTVFILLSLLGPTLAIRLNLNSGQVTEFGQGVYELKACQSWIQINLDSAVFTANPTNGSSAGTYLNRVDVENLNTTSCKSTVLHIKFFTTGNPSELSLFNGMDLSNSLILSTSVSLKIDDTGVVSIAPRSDANGNPITDASNSENTFGEKLVYLPNTGTYSITFPAPLALMSSVNALTFESAS